MVEVLAGRNPANSVGSARGLNVLGAHGGAAISLTAILHDLVPVQAEDLTENSL